MPRLGTLPYCPRSFWTRDPRVPYKRYLSVFLLPPLSLQVVHRTVSTAATQIVTHSCLRGKVAVRAASVFDPAIAPSEVGALVRLRSVRGCCWGSAAGPVDPIIVWSMVVLYAMALVGALVRLRSVRGCCWGSAAGPADPAIVWSVFALRAVPVWPG